MWPSCTVVLLHLFFWHQSAVSLNGTQSGNNTEKFVGFIISVHNEFKDEESGQFVKRLPQGVSMTECHFHEDPRANSVRCFLLQVICFLIEPTFVHYTVKKAWKINSGLYGIRTRDLCDTDVSLLWCPKSRLSLVIGRHPTDGKAFNSWTKMARIYFLYV